MDESSRRSSSPYHEKCFPPYCDSAHQVDKASVGKMSRSDLEDKYIIFADENLELKKQIRSHEKHIQRLQTAMQRQDYLDKRAGKSPTSCLADSNRVPILEAQNKNLQAKVKVLKQQLMNHSFIHSKESRLADAKRQGKSPRESSELPSQTQSAREAKPDRNTTALKMKIAELENELDSQKNKYKARIAQLEKELSAMEKDLAKSATSVNEKLSETSRQVKDNTELIKLRMQEEKQAEELADMREKLDAALAEVDKLKQELQDAKDQIDELKNDLDRERNKSATALSQGTHLETIKALEEQIRDLQNEKDTLKDTNEKLFLLTQNKSEKSVKIASGHDLQISQLQESLKDNAEELEEKKEKIKELEKKLEDLEKKLEDLKNLPPPECEECNDLKKQLNAAIMERDQLQKAPTEQKAPKEQNAENPEELGKLRDEVQKLNDEVDRLQDELERLKDERDRLKDELARLKDERDRLKDELARLKDEMGRVRDENERKEKQLYEVGQELSVLRPIAVEHENCKQMVTPVASKPITSSKSIQNPSYDRFKEPVPVRSEDSDDVLRRQNQRLEDDLNRALRELRELRPIAEEHKHCDVLQKEIIAPDFYKEYVSEEAPAPVYPASPVRSHVTPVRSNVTPTPVRSNVTSVRSNVTPTPVRSNVTPVRSHVSPPRSPVTPVSSKAPTDYVSHVTPPPSIHCVERVPLNDPAQKANLLIVSQHDFERVMMQKKRYSAEVETMEPMDGQKVLNCKLEICMYDLDMDDRMLEYLRSIQPDPKVFVEWSFVGLDQRTAPLPAEQALFYTNVMYYGPLSNEIKSYLNKVEMPIDLYLVNSSGNPVKVAEGTLNMLPAMEQPNRGFMRSVFLRGTNLPSKYATNQPMATIHCSFILHECCLGDPPFRDQIEVSIGTLYLKNRDGGVVPDHATHIYIEYAVLGHCGPELETDSVPRGEVMKFNHSKKLRINEENTAHLKEMLEDRNPKPLRFTILAEPCNLLSESEVETVGHADINLNEAMIRPNQDLVSSQVPVYSMEGEHLGTLSVTVLGVNTLQQVYAEPAH